MKGLPASPVGRGSLSPRATTATVVWASLALLAVAGVAPALQGCRAAAPLRVVRVAALGGGRWATYAVDETGRVWAWGDNHLRQLGHGEPASRPVPSRVVGLAGVVALSAAGDAVYALRADGTVWTWGAGWSSQLDGSDDSSIPVQVPGLFGMTAIAAGGLEAFALAKDGTVWVWGRLPPRYDSVLPGPVSGGSRPSRPEATGATP